MKSPEEANCSWERRENSLGKPWFWLAAGWNQGASDLMVQSGPWLPAPQGHNVMVIAVGHCGDHLGKSQTSDFHRAGQSFLEKAVSHQIHILNQPSSPSHNPRAVGSWEILKMGVLDIDAVTHSLQEPCLGKRKPWIFEKGRAAPVGETAELNPVLSFHSVTQGFLDPHYFNTNRMDS